MKQFIFCPQGGVLSAYIPCPFLPVEATVDELVVTMHTLRPACSPCRGPRLCALMTLNHNSGSPCNSDAPSYSWLPRAALERSTLLQGGLGTVEDPVITHKGLVINPSLSSYVDHFLSNDTFKPSKPLGRAALLVP